MPDLFRRGGPPRLLLASAGLALVLLAGCGTGTSQATTDAGASTTPPGAGPSGTGGGAGNGAQAFRDCLAQHGVTLPSRGTGGGQGAGGGAGGNFGLDMTNPTVQAAMDACNSLRPTDGGRGANFQAFQAYRSCLKDNGVNVPDITRPNGQGTSGSGNPGAGSVNPGTAAVGTGAANGQPPGSRPPNPGLFGIDPNDPNLAAAQAKCQVLLPTTVPTGQTGQTGQTGPGGQGGAGSTTTAGKA